jgi:hypothetical protein
MGEVAMAAGDGNSRAALVAMMQNGSQRTWFLSSRIRWKLVMATSTQDVDGRFGVGVASFLSCVSLAGESRVVKGRSPEDTYTFRPDTLKQLKFGKRMD